MMGLLSSFAESLKKLPYAVFVVTILLLSVAVFYRQRYVTVRHQLNAYEYSHPLVSYGVGEVVDTARFSFAVTKIAYDDQGIKEYPAPPGMQFLMIDITLFNKTSSSIYFLPVTQTYVRDQQGNRYDISTAPKIIEPSIAGEIVPLIGYNGRLGFVVPKSAEGLEFVCDLSSYPNENSIIYNLETRP